MLDNYFLVVNKKKGETSYDCIRQLKRLLPKKSKIGHLGTLDPMATGVLLIGVNKAAKLFDFLSDKVKTYEAEFEFGRETESLDAMTETINTDDKEILIEDIEKILPKFIGKISQMPPKYSAKHINGVRAYELARKNIEFELKPKEIEIFSISATKTERKNVFKFHIECGAGTYIRSICRDIAYAMNTYGTMIKLTRTKINNIDISKAKSVEDISLEEDKISIDELVKNIPVIKFTEKEKKDFYNGIKLYNKDLQNNSFCRLCEGEKTFGIGKIIDGRVILSVNLD